MSEIPQVRVFSPFEVVLEEVHWPQHQISPFQELSGPVHSGLSISNSCWPQKQKHKTLRPATDKGQQHLNHTQNPHNSKHLKKRRVEHDVRYSEAVSSHLNHPDPQMPEFNFPLPSSVSTQTYSNPVKLLEHNTCRCNPKDLFCNVRSHACRGASNNQEQ